MEKALTKISKGEMEIDKFMNSIKRYVNYLVKYAEGSKGKVAFDEEIKKQNKNMKPQKPKGKIFGDCPICKEGKILENSKAYYCSEWRNNCKLTIWKNTLDRYGNKLDEDTMIKLLKDKEIKEFDVIMPDTKEKRKATLSINEQGIVKLLNMKQKDVII